MARDSVPIHSINSGREVAERQLTQFFAATPGIEIVADTPRNRVLVRGTPDVLKQAGELLARLDPPVAVPALAAPAPQVNQQPMQRLETYPLTPNSQAILAALQKQAAGRPDIRIAVDERTSQALVLAPDSIHTQIRDKVAQAGAQAARSRFSTWPSGIQRNAPAAPVAPQSAPVPQQLIPPQSMPQQVAPIPPQQSDSQAIAAPNIPLQLQNLRADDLRMRLERLLRGRCRPAPTPAASGRPLRSKRCRVPA